MKQSSFTVKTCGDQYQDEQIHYQIKVHKLNKPILCKLNYNY